MISSYPFHSNRGKPSHLPGGLQLGKLTNIYKSRSLHHIFSLAKLGTLCIIPSLAAISDIATLSLTTPTIGSFLNKQTFKQTPIVSFAVTWHGVYASF